ncbi:MAG: class I SAM-dependent rRNA methyltransferase [Hydrogenophilus sp.]|nr:class I SAM-dependent rRNA methyltransferase [Hydrogenophilus sp.]
MAELVLKVGKERSVIDRHPWIYAQSVARINGRVGNGETVTVVDAKGKPLACAAVSLHSSIRARVWHFAPEKGVDDAFFGARIAAAVGWRRTFPTLAGQEGIRLVHGEADGLPGVIVDRYGEVLVMQLTFAGADRWREAIVAALRAEVPEAKALFERSDSEIRQREGLPPRRGVVWGALPAAVTIEEHGVRFLVDVEQGHKTGFYLDQRENRRLVQALAKGMRVLNAFCYTGGFTLHALRGGASEVWSIDSSSTALALLAENLALNEMTERRTVTVEGDVFRKLREWYQSGERFDLVILDPPKFAPSAAYAQKAKRAYYDVNLFGMRLVRPGGYLLTFSCSGGIGAGEFQEIVAAAAVANRRSGQIAARLTAGADHPIGLAAPEGEYLKGVLVRLD